MEAPRLNRSLWLAESEPGYPALEGDADDVVDAVVVGAGITGATTAFLLAEAGASVALLDSSRVAHGATGYTTAKLTVGHNIVYRTLVGSYGEEVARRFARSNGEAIERVAGLVARHALDCDFERATNYVYAERPESVPELEEEAEAARAAGVAAELTTVTDLPYPVAAALRVDGQAQFHPWKYVAGLVRLVAERGGRVYELTRATHVAKGDPCVVTTPRGRVRGRHVVLATQLPFLDRGLFFARAHPVKSYAVAAPVPDDVAPRGMYISCDAPTRSVRSAPGPDGARFVIVGGEGHKPGADPATEERYARLEEFLAERFGGAQAEYRWSTHDYVPVDHLPYIGRLRGGDPRILVATGFAKWGMTKGTLAASILADSVLGRPNEYAELYDATRANARRSALAFARENAGVGLRFFRDRLRSRPAREEVERLAPGEGTIVRAGVGQYAAHRDEAGVLHVLSARCTHLGCIVGWNPADRAWECPCHGSRFAGDGTLVQGPATSDLPRRSLEA